MTHRTQKYDIFISYRRDGGENEAWKLKLFLEQMGYRVFMDRESLRSGDFNEQLYQCIDQCKDFLLICSPNALERCRNPEDWVRKEIIRAMQGRKNIIPVWVNGFDSSQLSQLPQELAGIARLQAVTPRNATYEESVRKLSTYLLARPVTKYKQRLSKGVSALAGVLLIAVLGVFIFNQFHNQSTDFPANQAEEKQVEAMNAAASAQLSFLNQNLWELEQALTVCENYVAGYTSNDADVRLECTQRKQIIAQQSLPYCVVPDNEIDYAYFAHLDRLTTVAQRTADYAKYLDYLDTVIFETNLGNDQKKEILEHFSTIAEQDAELGVVETFLLFLPVTQPETTLSSLLDTSKTWKALPGFGKSWISGTDRESELSRRVEIAQDTRHDALIAIESISGVRLLNFNISIDS